MNRIRKYAWVVTMAVAILALGVEAQNWSPAPGSWVKVEGKSTVHDWEVESTDINGKVTFPASFFEMGGTVDATVSIPVDKIKSDSARMDRVMYKALKSDKNPDIRYRLLKATPSSANKAHAVGELTIAGTTKEIEMDVTLSRPDEKTLVIAGTAQIDMTEFGIDPPTAMLGAIRTDKNVTVSFQWVMAVAK